jgi:hypothetical protein
MMRRNSMYIRWIVFALCAFAGLSLGTQFPAQLNPTSWLSRVAVTAQAQATPPSAPFACPPATISGTIGSGSPNFAFVTGNQTSRLFRNSIESDCGSQKANPGITDAGVQFKFDAYTFTNTSFLSICVTVITTAGANNQILTAAYQGSFNPANVQTNYLGDAGNSEQTRAFSFTVPGNQSFVVVQSRVNNAGNPPSLGYTFRVLGLPGCNSCPPQIMTGTIGSGSPQYPANSDQQTGRLFRNATASECSPAKPVPSVEDAQTSFAYDAYTFLNPSVSSVCVTVNTTAAANNQILTAAYLNRFNPFDVQENYLGDAGNSNQQRSFSFIVPGRRSFVVVQSRVNTAGNPPSLSYFFSVNGLTGCSACPAITVNPTNLPNGLLGNPYPAQQFTQTGGVGAVTWSVIGSLPNNMTLNPATGVLSGTPTASGNFSFSIRATDSNQCLGERVYFMSIIACTTITLTPDALLPSAAVGALYSQQIGATGGTPAYSFILFSGSLPDGITLSTSGLLSGTPTSTTPKNFTIRATDANGCTGTKTFTLITCGVITVNPATIPNAFAGTFYTRTFTQAGGGADPIWSSSGTLPAGLTLNPGTGVLSGTPTTAGTATFTIRATAFNGCFGERSYTVTISGNGLQFFPLAHPVRLLDTRPGQVGCFTPGAPIPGGTARTQLARGTCEGLNIPANAAAITGNITTVQSGGGFLTLFPSDAQQPTVANTNYNPNEIINNVFTVGLGADGAFKIFAFNTTDVVVDVTGFYAPPGNGGLFFHPLPAPVRLLETRAGQSVGCFKPGTPIPSGVAQIQQGNNTCGIPASAQALVGNATTVTPAGPGFLTLFPNGAAQPTVAASNFNGGDVVNGPFTVGLGNGGSFKIFASTGTELVIDVLGYYSAEVNDANGAGLLFTSLGTPVRLLETRSQPANLTGCFKPNAPLLGNQTATQPARGTCQGQTIPNTALAVVGNATVVFPTGGGFLTLWPSSAAQPTAANSNYKPGEVNNRHFIVGLGNGDGAFKMFSFATTELVIDLSGYFAP